MHVSQRTDDILVIEESPSTNLLLGSAFCGFGVVGMLLVWKAGIPALLIGVIFLGVGLKLLLFGRTTTHRFERWRAAVVIESRSRSGAARRELPFDQIAEIAVEKAPKGHSYYVYYVTRDGERIRWSDTYDGSEERTRECANAARAWLGMPNPDPSFDPARDSSLSV